MRREPIRIGSVSDYLCEVKIVVRMGGEDDKRMTLRSQSSPGSGVRQASVREPLRCRSHVRLPLTWDGIEKRERR